MSEIVRWPAGLTRQALRPARCSCWTVITFEARPSASKSIAPVVCSPNYSGSTLIIWSIRTSEPISWQPGGLSLAGTRSTACSPPRAPR